MAYELPTQERIQSCVLEDGANQIEVVMHKNADLYSTNSKFNTYIIQGYVWENGKRVRGYYLDSSTKKALAQKAFVRICGNLNLASTPRTTLMPSLAY